MDDQQEFVDQAVGQKRADQLATADDREVTGRALLQLGHGGEDVTVQESRVGPIESRL